MAHDTLPRQREQPRAPGERSLGLPQSTALIVGSIIGVGIFNLPYSLAGYGPISLLAMALTTVGAVALALMFAVLSRRLPGRRRPVRLRPRGLRQRVGFANAWSYWITAWAGNAAIVVGWVFYVEHFVNKDGVTGWSILIALVGLWIPAAVNLTGVRNMGQFQVVTTILKFVPLALMSTVGLFFINPANYTPWNVSGGTNLSAVGGAMAICLFSYLGVETAAVAAGKVRNPERNIPRSTVLGTLASAVVYLLSMLAVFGILPTSELAKAANKASYSVAFNQIVGGGTWAGNLVAVAVIISGLGALNGWTMICAEMPLAAARDGLFPARFGRLSSRRVPAFGHHRLHRRWRRSPWSSATWAPAASTVFTTLVLMTGITAAVPYAFSALAQLKWRWADHQHVHPAGSWFDLTVAAVALFFSILFIYYSRNTGETWYVVWGPFLMSARRGAGRHPGLPRPQARPHDRRPERI